MKYYFKLLRPRDWVKNLFLIIPSFFAGQIYPLLRSEHMLFGFISFCCFASCIYIINDYRDIEEDRRHPVKSKRPLASGKVKKPVAVIIGVFILVLGTGLALLADHSFKFLFILGVYFFINLAYSFGLKNIAIIDILILATGFVLRVKGGAIIAQVDTSAWLIIMTFLLSLFMAIAKRRDDLLLTGATGTEMRKSISGYNLDFLDTMTGLFSAIIIVAYINYTVSEATITRLGTYRLYYTSLFVIAGVMRYLQITFVQKKSGSPTDILYKDVFIQITIALWILSFFVILYLKDITIFKR
ncbi:MAG: decaprenyl-phosphate phosphoribosyltransferase [Bacteroidota bacterium]|nr:decaprenyl-phosphate phosphoribosyltransferase [Bacteroidota bacterium]MDP4211003.1 decaprenyl-phosphate phosphoribosyltransferase [Bacteroidota bacterium]MDP4248775.1 decaprenyl-phosphate phosphoribosyltransferase [Bacteroidota bacterium]